jgi:hypothetical protein
MWALAIMAFTFMLVSGDHLFPGVYY